MDIPYLINLLQNKFNYLNNARASAVAVGDIGGVTAIDQDMLTTQNTIAQLKLLQSITQAAADTNTSAAEVIASGLDTIQNTPVVPDGPTGVLDLYDLSTYATDPIYLQKIADILSVMGAMDSVGIIDAYINQEAIGSPLNGQMIFNAVEQYKIDARLIVAMLELESRFGTAGVAVYTLNPGNVGNTGEETRTYSSWQDGVSAVARWLDRHRVETPKVEKPPVENEIPDAITPEATTTPEVILPEIKPQATTTPEVVLPDMTNQATTSPEIILPDAASATTTIEAVPTPETTATSTQAYGRVRKIKVKIDSA